jgi:hypothetical protein
MTEADQRARPVRWDRSRQREISSSLATARAREDQVAIDFGDLVRAADGIELSPRLQRRIVMGPVAAKRLCDMLARLTTEGGVTADAKS